MIGLVLLLLGLGIFLSALFSGSETGFYRVTRVRLLLDGLDGDRVSRMLLRLTNHPALFVATTLIGNNVANYLVSLGIVLSVQLAFGESQVAEMLAPMVLSPWVFVYCELLPKQLFFRSPNRLLRRCGPLLLLFTILFAPVAAILWTLGWLLEKLIGQTPLRVRLTLARKELEQVLQEGQEAGILRPAQRNLAQRLFANASQPVINFSTPLGRVASVPLGAEKELALRLARRQQTALIPVRQADGRDLVGYMRVIDLQLLAGDTIEQARPMPRFPRGESHLTALICMQSEKAEAAVVEDQKGTTIGLLYLDQLTEPLFLDT
jgi:CBS domain containing-hemolysin-like protein